MSRHDALAGTLALLAASASVLLLASGASAAPSAAPAGGGPEASTAAPDMPEQRAVPIPDGPAPQGSGKRAAQWWETGEYAGPTQNCVFQYPEELGRAWAGWFGDLGVSPSTNQVYYVKVGFGISGNPCGGGAYVHAEIVPPANTELAISQTNPVRCFYDGLNTDYHEFNAAQGCPQQPGRGMYGGYSFDPKNQYSSWATATGTLYELYIPVKTTRPLNGIVPSSGPCNTCLYAGVWMIDGWNSPWVWPRIPVYVGGSASTSGPFITYPGPSTSGVSFDGAQKKVFATIHGNLFTEGTTGPVQFEVGFDKGDYRFTGGTLNVPDANQVISEQWYFTPGKEYHFRLCYRPTGGNKVCGDDQSFTAPPDTTIGGVDVDKQAKEALISFGSPTPGMEFQCALDGGKWKACDPPHTYKRLKKGKHEVAVRAADAYGNRDKTPAKESFKV